MAQSTADPADDQMRDVEDTVGHATGVHEVTGKHEKRNGEKRERRRAGVEPLHEDRQQLGADCDPHRADSDHAERYGNRRAQQDQGA